jgi:hypothetical protein
MNVGQDSGKWVIFSVNEDKGVGSADSCLQHILSDITIEVSMETQVM